MSRDTVIIGRLSALKVSLMAVVAFGLVGWSGWTLLLHYDELSGRQQTGMISIFAPGVPFAYLVLLMMVRAFTSTPALFIRDGRVVFLFAFLQSSRLDEVKSVTLLAPPPWKTRMWLTFETRSGASKVVPTFPFRTPKDVMLSRLADAGLPVDRVTAGAPSKQAADERAEPR